MNQLISTYSFSASARTVTLTGVTINLSGLSAIIDMATGAVLFIPGAATLVPVVSGSVVTLNAAAPLAGAHDGDALLILYDDGETAAKESGNLAALVAGSTSMISALNDIYGALTPTPVPLAFVDHSLNTPTIPAIGANFSNAGPYANYRPIVTVAANVNRKMIDIENTSGGPILIMIDDGTANFGGQPNSVTLVPLTGGRTIGSQGGSYQSTTEVGRIQIFAYSLNAQVSVREGSHS